MKAKFWAVGVACFLVFCVAPASAFAGSISGSVTNATTGLPMDEVTVCAEGVGSGSGSHCIASPDNGEYTIAGLSTGEYRVSFQPDLESNFVRDFYPGTLYEEDATSITLEASEEDVIGIDVAIEEGAEISGTVVGEGDIGPLEDIEVCARETVGARDSSFCEQTESDGTYRIPGVPADTYTITFENRAAGVEYATRYYDEESFEEEAAEVLLESGQRFTADATMLRVGTIAGTVTEAGQPRAFGNICAYTLTKVEVACGFTYPDGMYRLEELPVGSYILEAEFAGEPQTFSGNVESFGEATPVTVEAEKVTTEDIEIPGPPGISGTVLDGSTGEAPTGSVNACASSDNGTNCVQIESDGTYRIFGLEPGEYFVYFEGEGYVRQFFDGVGDEIEATLVTVGEQTVNGIDATLEPAGSIAGHVTAAADGTNLRNIEVCAMADGAVVECRSTKTDGTYEVPNLAAGEYMVRFAAASGYVTQYFSGKATLAEAETVTVATGEVTGEVDAAMAKPERPHNTALPAVSGVGKVGETLSCSEGTWAGAPASFTYKYSWYRGSSTINGARSSTYTVGAGDAGTQIKCGVAATNFAGSSSTSQSSNSIAVAAVRQLTVTPAGNGSGTVTSSPAGIECGADCGMTANEGETVTLTATAATHSEFTGWSGDCPGTDPCEVTLGSTDASVTATFTKVTHPVEVTVAGAGSVSADSGAIAGCTESGGTCSGTYDEGAEVTLTATPDLHHTFTGWTGCTTVAGDECEVTVEGLGEVEATFDPILRIVSIIKEGNGSGTVTSAPAGIECGTECDTSFVEGETVTLTATPSAHSEFTGWSGGGCSGTTPCSVTLGATDEDVTATFAKITHPVDLTVTGAGSVSADSGAISDCTEVGGTCSGTYDETTEVTLTATPDAHHTFTGWAGCTTEAGDECTVTVDGAENLTATFAPITHQLSVAKSGDGTGSVTSAPAGIECGASCAAAFDEGTTITLTAVADSGSGSEFTGWSGACSGTGPCVVTLGEDAGVVAGFSKKQSEGSPGNGGGSDNGGSSTPSSPSGSNPPATTTPPPPAHVTQKKLLQCKKGFRKVKRKGKARCGKVKHQAKKAKGKR